MHTRDQLKRFEKSTHRVDLLNSITEEQNQVLQDLTRKFDEIGPGAGAEQFGDEDFSHAAQLPRARARRHEIEQAKDDALRIEEALAKLGVEVRSRPADGKEPDRIEIWSIR